MYKGEEGLPDSTASETTPPHDTGKERGKYCPRGAGGTIFPVHVPNPIV